MIEVELPDGRIAEFPDGMKPQDIEAVLAKQFPAKVDGEMSKPRAALSGLQQGATFGLADEFTAARIAPFRYLGSQFSDNPKTLGEAYATQLEMQRAEYEKAQQDQPIATLAGEMVGGMATGYGGAKLGGQQLARQIAKKPFRSAAGIGGVSGGLYGFGTGEGGAGERLESAQLPAAAGMVAGPIGAYIGQKAGPLLSRAGQRVRRATGFADDAAEALPVENMTTRSIDATPEPARMAGSNKAMAQIESAIRKDYGDQADQVLQAWKSGDVSLAELSGVNMARKARGAAQYAPGEARAKKFFDEKIAASPERVVATINKNVMDGSSFYATVDDMVAAGQKKAAPLYKEAYALNPTVSSDRLNRILQTPSVRGALSKVVKNTQDEMRLLAKPDPELTALAKELGQQSPGGVSKGFSLRTLDAVKKQMDGDLYALNRKVKAGNATPAESDTYRAMLSAKNALIDEIDNLDTTGTYKKARATAGDYLSSQKFMNEGLKFESQDPELLFKSINKMSDADKSSYILGVSKALNEKINNRAIAGSPLKKVLGTPNQKKRLQMLLGPSQYKKLERDLIAEDKLYNLRNMVLGGSPTTGKMIDAAEMAAGGAEAMEMLATGNPKALGLAGIRSAVRKMFDGINDDTANAISQIMYSTNPQEKVLLLQKLDKSKLLSSAEKQAAKTLYFQIDDAIKNRALGASAAGIGAATTMKDVD